MASGREPLSVKEIERNEKARNGDAAAQFELAKDKLKNSKDKKSKDEAWDWLMKSAKQGHLPAVEYVDNNYFKSRHFWEKKVPSWDMCAWYELAIKKTRNISATLRLAELYIAVPWAQYSGESVKISGLLLYRKIALIPLFKPELLESAADINAVKEAKERLLAQAAEELAVNRLSSNREKNFIIATAFLLLDEVDETQRSTWKAWLSNYAISLDLLHYSFDAYLGKEDPILRRAILNSLPEEVRLVVTARIRDELGIDKYIAEYKEKFKGAMPSDIPAALVGLTAEYVLPPLKAVEGFIQEPSEIFFIFTRQLRQKFGTIIDPKELVHVNFILQKITFYENDLGMKENLDEKRRSTIPQERFLEALLYLVETVEIRKKLVVESRGLRMVFSKATPFIKACDEVLRLIPKSLKPTSYLPEP